MTEKEMRQELVKVIRILSRREEATSAEMEALAKVAQVIVALDIQIQRDMPCDSESIKRLKGVRKWTENR